MTSFFELEAALRARGLTTRAVRFRGRRPGEVRTPMILHVDGDHFLTALPASPDDAILIDPPNAPKLVTWSEFGPRWNGEALVVDTPLPRQP